MLKFAEKVDKFANSNFKDIDKNLLSLVDMYYEDIENEMRNEIPYNPDNPLF